LPDVRVVRPGFRENVMMPIQAVVGTVPEAILYSRRFKNFAAMCNPSTPRSLLLLGIELRSRPKGNRHMKTFVSSSPAQGGQRWPKLTLATAVVLALFFSAVGTSDAQTERVRSQQVDQVRPALEAEALRLGCGPDFVNGESGVLCQWSEAANPRTRGYKLFRIADGSPREVVTTVGLNGRLGYFDTDVTAPSLLVYVVTSVNQSGRLIGQSAPVQVRFGQDLEQLRMACAQDFVNGERGVLCRWSESTQPQARGYLVYRIVDRDQREVIARLGLDERNAFFDTAVTPGATLTYGVISVDGAGSVVAAGGPQQLTWPAAG
jgi:hypothetical protein